jgi:hypothetical protein
MLPTWVYTFVAVGVTMVWLVANIVAVIRGDQVDAQLHVLMGAVVGGTIGVQALERRTLAAKRGE